MTFEQGLMGLLYVIFLVLVVVILAFKSRGVRENYREAMYIGLTMGFTVCIFTIWILGGFIAPPHYKDVCVAAGLIACAAITFVVMFMPKGRQLSAMGQEGVYAEDRNEVYAGSSTQSTGSGGTPSPSFFPIKPGKLVHQFRESQRERLDTPPTPKKHGKCFYQLRMSLVHGCFASLAKLVFGETAFNDLLLHFHFFSQIRYHGWKERTSHASFTLSCSQDLTYFWLLAAREASIFSLTHKNGEMASLLLYTCD